MVEQLIQDQILTFNYLLNGKGANSDKNKVSRFVQFLSFPNLQFLFIQDWKDRCLNFITFEVEIFRDTIKAEQDFWKKLEVLREGMVKEEKEGKSEALATYCKGRELFE